jgi:hypothetical protein
VYGSVRRSRRNCGAGASTARCATGWMVGTNQPSFRTSSSVPAARTAMVCFQMDHPDATTRPRQAGIAEKARTPPNSRCTTLTRPLVSPGFPGCDVAPPTPATAGLASLARPSGGLKRPPTKPFSGTDEVSLKQESALMGPDQTTGCDHVGTHHQLSLSWSVQAVFERHATATPLAVGSIG